MLSSQSNVLVDCSGLGLNIDPSVTTVSSRPLWGKKMKSLDASQSRNFVGAQKQMLSYSKISYSRYHQPQTVNGRDSFKMLAAPLTSAFWLLSRSYAQSEETAGLFQLSSLEESLEWLEKMGPDSSFEQQFAQCILMAHRLGVQYWHIICGGSYGCCLDFSISALRCIHLLQFAAPSLSQLSSQLPPGTLSCSIASWFQSNKSVYFSLLSFRSVSKCCPIAAQGTDTISNSSNCQWRWLPCELPGGTREHPELELPDVSICRVGAEYYSSNGSMNKHLYNLETWMSLLPYNRALVTELLGCTSFRNLSEAIVHPSIHTTKGVN